MADCNLQEKAQTKHKPLNICHKNKQLWYSGTPYYRANLLFTQVSLILRKTVKAINDMNLDDSRFQVGKSTVKLEDLLDIWPIIEIFQ